jgi:hypothetical protein
MLDEGAGVGAPKGVDEDVEAEAPKRGVEEPKDGAVEEAAPKEKDGAAVLGVELPPNEKPAKGAGLEAAGGGYVSQPEGSVGG